MDGRKGPARPRPPTFLSMLILNNLLYDRGRRLQSCGIKKLRLSWGLEESKSACKRPTLSEQGVIVPERNGGSAGRGPALRRDHGDGGGRKWRERERGRRSGEA